MQFRVLSYNVQAPFLPSPEPPDRMPHSLRPLQRQGYVWKIIQAALRAQSTVPAFVCLQEVCSEWRDIFLRDFELIYGMKALEHNYSPPRFPPLCTMIFYRADLFDCRINSIEFTGIVRSDEQRARLGLTDSEIEINRSKRHAVMSGIFTEKYGTGDTRQQLIIGTYHAPCIFKFPHCQQLHVENAIEFLSRPQSEQCAIVLAGDFNMLPTDQAYKSIILPNDQIVNASCSSSPSDSRDTSCAANFRGCIDYVFSNRNVSLNGFALFGFGNLPYLCESQPSDHALLQAIYSC